MILFFSRQIGLSEDGSAIPILGGTRLTGRAGGYSMGALKHPTTREGTTPSANFTALRLRRDVFAASDIGVMFLNKEVNGPHFNRVFGGDANFRFFQNLEVNFAGAKTFSPEVACRGKRRRLVYENELQLSVRSPRGPWRLSNHRRAVQQRNGIRAAPRRRQRRVAPRRALPAPTGRGRVAAAPPSRTRTGRSRTSRVVEEGSSPGIWIGTGRSPSTTARSWKSR